ncbi:unnamed protein product [Dicrocoelium dendriticum]|nr:unnamed protein product [Dicrocoelium dendriticum]
MNCTSNRRMKLPILSIISSLPVWAFTVVIIGFDWNSYTLLTSIPSYMREVLYFDISENAGLSALPYTAVWFGQLWFGWLSDRLLSRNVFSLNVVRRLMTSVGMFGPGVVMIAISFFDCRYKYVVVALFTFGLVLNSGMFAGGLLNPIEISPRHSGIIFSAANTLSALTGVAAPLVVDVLTPQHTYSQWRNVFYVGAAVYFATGLFFVCFSSSTIQLWAVVPEDRLDDAELNHRTLSKEVEPLNELSDPVVIKVVDARHISA